MDGSVNLLEVCRRPWVDLAPEICEALVYLDAGAGEVVHLSLGLPFLLGECTLNISALAFPLTTCISGLGVANVCELETACPQDAALPLLMTGQAPAKLAVFVTRLLTEGHQYVLRAIKVSSRP
jgi:hypothetical protein